MRERAAMSRVGRTLLVAGAMALVAGACSKSGSAGDAAANHPAVIERVAGEGARVTLTDKAIERIGLETAVIKDAPSTSGGAPRMLPNSAVLYDASGRTWAYTTATHGTYVRAPITIDRVVGDQAYLSDGPPSGTEVVTVGAEELFGAESTFGED
jgi:hypothetical protein